MATQLRFIHTADFHLGAPFLGLRIGSGEWADRMVESIPEAYERLIDAAINHCVDFVVMAGDIFDKSRPSYGEYLCFVHGLERLARAGIPVYLCTGNHDPLVAWQREYGALPANAYLFGAGEDAGFYLYERDGQPVALLAGRGFDRKTWSHPHSIADGITRQAAEQALGATAPFAVGVLHTGLDIDPTRAPCNPAMLRAAGMDYWALGHVHTPMRDNPRDPKIVFPGCIQGRKIRDNGPRGAYLVTLEVGQPNRLEFIPTASVVWEPIELDVSACTTLADIAQEALAALFRVNGKAACDEMIERITLVGTTPMHTLLQQPQVRDDLRRQINESYSGFYCDALLDATRAPFDDEKARAEGLFAATFLQVHDESAANRAGEQAFLQQAFIDQGIGISDIPEATLARMEDEARSLVLDLLTHGGDA